MKPNKINSDKSPIDELFNSIKKGNFKLRPINSQDNDNNNVTTTNPTATTTTTTTKKVNENKLTDTTNNNNNTSENNINNNNKNNDISSFIHQNTQPKSSRNDNDVIIKNKEKNNSNKNNNNNNNDRNSFIYEKNKRINRDSDHDSEMSEYRKHILKRVQKKKKIEKLVRSDSFDDYNNNKKNEDDLDSSYLKEKLDNTHLTSTKRLLLKEIMLLRQIQADKERELLERQRQIEIQKMKLHDAMIVRTSMSNFEQFEAPEFDNQSTDALIVNDQNQLKFPHIVTKYSPYKYAIKNELNEDLMLQNGEFYETSTVPANFDQFYLRKNDNLYQKYLTEATDSAEPYDVIPVKENLEEKNNYNETDFNEILNIIDEFENIEKKNGINRESSYFVKGVLIKKVGNGPIYDTNANVKRAISLREASTTPSKYEIIQSGVVNNNLTKNINDKIDYDLVDINSRIKVMKMLNRLYSVSSIELDSDENLTNSRYRKRRKHSYDASSNRPTNKYERSAYNRKLKGIDANNENGIKRTNSASEFHSERKRINGSPELVQWDYKKMYSDEKKYNKRPLEKPIVNEKPHSQFIPPKKSVFERIKEVLQRKKLKNGEAAPTKKVEKPKKNGKKEQDNISTTEADVARILQDIDNYPEDPLPPPRSSKIPDQQFLASGLPNPSFKDKKPQRPKRPLLSKFKKNKNDKVKPVNKSPNDAAQKKPCWQRQQQPKIKKTPEELKEEAANKKLEKKLKDEETERKKQQQLEEKKRKQEEKKRENERKKQEQKRKKEEARKKRQQNNKKNNSKDEGAPKPGLCQKIFRKKTEPSGEPKLIKETHKNTDVFDPKKNLNRPNNDNNNTSISDVIIRRPKSDETVELRTNPITSSYFDSFRETIPPSNRNTTINQPNSININRPVTPQSPEVQEYRYQNFLPGLNTNITSRDSQGLSGTRINTRPISNNIEQAEITNNRISANLIQSKLENRGQFVTDQLNY